MDEYFLFVHGWNMEENEKKRWAETLFKRLWWQGYQGGMGLFDWPTLEWKLPVGFINDLRNFSDSDYIAWQSSESLKSLLTNLKTEGKKLGVLAHSQGNVVVGEALRKYTGPNIDTYIASQAALPANAYTNTGLQPAPEWFSIVEMPLQTPDLFGHFDTGNEFSEPYLRGNISKVLNIYNYYNEYDWALTGLTGWEGSNAMKPHYNFHYNGSMDQYNEGVDEFSQKLFIDPNLPDPYITIPLSIYEETDLYRIFSYIAESRSRALGTQNINEANINSKNLFDAFNFNDEHYSHSRQFRSDVIKESKYSAEVVKNCGFDSTLLEME